MKKLVSIFILILAVSCAEKEPTTSIQKTTSDLVSDDQKIPVRSVSMYDVPLTDRKAAMEHPYDLSYSIEEAADGKFVLNTSIKLFGGSFFVSPHSKTNFKGIFTIDTAQKEHLKFSDEFQESPRSIEEIDPHRFVNGPVNWVSVDTDYKHPFTINTQEDFDVYGKYIFTIEPKCTLEELPFVIKYRSGKFIMEKWAC